MATQKLVMAFVTLIIGISLLGVIATTGNEVTSQDVVLNESLDLVQFRGVAATYNDSIYPNVTASLTNAYATTDWQYDDCAIAITLFALDNASALTAGTDYNVTSNGVIALYNSSGLYDTSNTSLITYTMCQDDYITLSWGRTILDIVPGFFSLALLMVSLALFYSVAKDTGII